MTETLCRACHDRPTNHAYICRDCADQLHGDLATIPTLAHQLELEATRQARKGHGIGIKARSAETPLPYNPAATNALNRLRHELVQACLEVNLDQRDGLPPDITPAMAIWLAHHETSIGQREQGGEICRGIRAAIRNGQRIIDNPPERRYIGECVCEDNRGHPTRLYARMGEPTYECPTCRQTWIVAERFAQLEADLADYGLTHREIETLMPHVPRSTLARWIHGDAKRGQRPKLAPLGTTATGEATYRYGDVLALDARRRSAA